MKEIRPYLVVVSALLSIISFPPIPLGVFIFISLAMLLYAVEEVSPSKAFKYGYRWGLIFHFGLLYYIAWVTVPGMMATVLIMSLIPACALWLFTRLVDRFRVLALLSFVSFFLAWNWLLTKSDLNYPWTDLGYSLSYMTPLIQAAEIAGIYLISLFILVINGLVYLSISNVYKSDNSRRKAYIYIAIAVIFSFYIYGEIRLTQLKDTPQKSLNVGLIQGNITKDVKWAPGNLQVSFDTYHNLSKQAVRDSAQLLIWPETAIPTYLAQEPPSMGQMRKIVFDLNTPVLTGTVFYETVGPREYIYFNSAILVEPGNDDYQLYSKMHLVPVSEKIPFSERYKILRDIHLGQADFSSGRSQTVFNLDGTKFGTLICFESAFPGFTNNYARMGAEFLVIITNDMWFGNTSLFEQHAMMAVFRAVENRIPVVRAGNTGISMAVDKRGRILAKSGVFDKEFIVAKIHPEQSTSAYNKIGDVIPQAATLIMFLALAVAIWKRKGYIERQYEE